MPYFRDRGYDVYAVSLRGHGNSRGHQWLDLWGLADYLADVRRAAAAIGRPLTLFGSSMGGLLVQRWLAAGHPGEAAVTIGSVPPTGTSHSIAGMLLGSPHDVTQVLQLAVAGVAHPRFLKLLAEQPLRTDAHDPHHRHLGRESARALWEMAWTPMVTRCTPACPVLAVHGECDRMVPASTAHHLGSYLGATVMTFAGIGHVPMIETEWERVAAAIGTWLAPGARAPG